ncbi:hypothetical protein [Ligilactobacillus ruminis]|uniref:hypothetical protein n=1 Tax=Ligilactobacillus ruminis TaxID=1623 RepID=UPI003D067AC5
MRTISVSAVMARIFFFFGQRAKMSLNFTDKEPIFADLSVNGSDFAKCSAAHHLLNHCT